jgi:ELWxxDGT repeat protein
MRVWRTDGSAAGTSFVPAVADYLGPLGGTPNGILFVRRDQNTFDYWLAASDGSTVTDLALIDDLSFYQLEPRLQLPNGVFLAMSSDSLGAEPWMTGGTPETTFQIEDIYPGTNGSVGYPFWSFPLQLDGGEILFHALSTDFDASPWITDGTTLGTDRLRQLDHQTSSHFPGYRVMYGRHSALGRRCLTTATEDATLTARWWSSAGTPSSTVLLPPSVPMGSTVAGNSVPFPKTKDRAILGVEHDNVIQLWGTDGTPAGSEEISTAFGPVELGSARFVPLTESILIDVGDSVWQSDGTLAGTVLLATLIDAQEGASTAGTSYLSAGDASTGIELWQQDDGLPPAPIADLEPGSASSTPTSLITDPDVDRGVFFFAATMATGREPWYSDGTPAGTHPLGDVFAGVDSSRTNSPDERGAEGVFLGPTLLFAANDGVHGNELWTSNGTPDSASLLVDLYPGDPGSDPAWFTRIGNLVYFVATVPGEGRELWRTDGTPGGTVLVADLRIGPDSSLPHDLVAHDGTIFFTASDGVNGSELWYLESQAKGPALLQDIHPGPGSSSPSRLSLSEDRLCFVATDGVHGFELWSLALDFLFVDGFESGNTDGWSTTSPVVP